MDLSSGPYADARCRHNGDIRVRPYRPGDDAAMLAAVRESLPELKPWMPWAHEGYSANEARSWVSTQVEAFAKRTAFEFAIVSSSGDAYLGGVGLNQLDAANGRANLGYWVRSRATRAGVATSAVRLLRDWAFENSDLVRLEILVAVGNTASLGVAERAGAIREGVLQRRLLLHGTPHDAVMFSFVRG